MRVSVSSLAAAAAITIAAPASAAEISFGFSGGTSSFSLARFDTSLGTLQSVTLTYDGTSRFTVPSAGPPTSGGTYSISNYFGIYAGPRTFDATASGSGALEFDDQGVATLVSTSSYNNIFTDASTLALFSDFSLPAYVAYDPPYIFNVSGASVDRFGTQKAGAFVSGTLTFTYLTPDDAVPEPETWAMMILGFGAMGTVVRRRKGALAA